MWLCGYVGYVAMWDTSSVIARIEAGLDEPLDEESRSLFGVVW